MMARVQRRLARWTGLAGAAVLAVALLQPMGSPAAATTEPVATGQLQTAQFDSHLTRAPYLTDLVGTHVAVNFATDRSATSGSVSYGPVVSGSCDPTTTVPATRRSITVGTVLEYQWTSELDLPASGSYCYRAYLGASEDLLGGNPSPRFTTQAPAGSSAPFSFDVMGDWGQVDASSQNPDQANLMKQIAASNARFMVTVGDNGYPNGNQVNYGDLQQTGKDTSAIFGPDFWTVPGPTTPIFTAPGNHGLSGTAHTDLTTWTQDQVVADSGGRYQNDVYCCVNNTKSTNYASEWYAFTAGNARFYVLDAAWGDSNKGTGTLYADDYAAHWAPGSPEVSWLASDLAAHRSQLKFAFFHFPLHADNPTESSDTYLQGPDSLEGLLASNGVQMVFNGHAHLYERNTPSAPGMPVSYVTGGGGGKLEPIGPCTPNDAYGIGWSPTKSKGSACGTATAPTAASQVYHFLKVTVSGSSVTVTPTDSTGNTFDVNSYDFAKPVDTTIDSGPAALTNAATATFAFHAGDSSATFSCTLDQAAQEPCTSPVTYSNLGDGNHTFTVAAAVGGATDTTPASRSWTIDTTPPPAPTGLVVQASSTGNDLSWSPVSDPGLAGYDVYRNGSLLGKIADTTSYADTQVTPDVSYSYQVSAVDDADNESPESEAASLPPPVEVPTAPPSATHLVLDGVRVQLPTGSRQVVTVNHTHGYHARVALWQKRGAGWHRVVTSRAARIGYGGLVRADRRRQGTGTTPLGTFGLTSAFGTHHRHQQWQLPYRRIRAGDYWVGDNRSASYNRYRNKAQGGFRWWLHGRANASERLAHQPRKYEYVVVTGFNESQVRHRGAGIFLHVTGRGATSGSVAAPRWFLRRALRVLDPARDPVIAVGR